MANAEFGFRSAEWSRITRPARGERRRWSFYSAFRVPQSAMAVKLAHSSDIHLTSKPLGWRPRDWFSKRATGWVNVRLLGRGRRFKQAPAVVAAMMRAIRERKPD